MNFLCPQGNPRLDSDQADPYRHSALDARALHGSRADVPLLRMPEVKQQGGCHRRRWLSPCTNSGNLLNRNCEVGPICKEHD